MSVKLMYVEGACFSEHEVDQFDFESVVHLVAPTYPIESFKDEVELDDLCSSELKYTIEIFQENVVISFFDNDGDMYAYIGPKSEYMSSIPVISIPESHIPLFWKQDPASVYYYIDPDYNEESQYVEELVKPRKAFLLQLTPEQIVNIEVIDQYKDDHEICIDADITFTNGDVLSMSAMCIICEFAACFYNWKSNYAKERIIDYIQYGVNHSC